MNIYSSSFQLYSISIYTTFTLFVTWWNWWSDLIKNLQPIQEHSKTTRLKFKSKTSYNFPPGSSSPSFHDKHIFLCKEFAWMNIYSFRIIDRRRKEAEWHFTEFSQSFWFEFQNSLQMLRSHSILFNRRNLLVGCIIVQIVVEILLLSI